jgi:hypothetical protein
MAGKKLTRGEFIGGSALVGGSLLAGWFARQFYGSKVDQG